MKFPPKFPILVFPHGVGHLKRHYQCFLHFQTTTMVPSDTEQGKTPLGPQDLGYLTYHNLSYPRRHISLVHFPFLCEELRKMKQHNITVFLINKFEYAMAIMLNIFCSLTLIITFSGFTFFIIFICSTLISHCN